MLYCILILLIAGHFSQDFEHWSSVSRLGISLKKGFNIKAPTKPNELHAGREKLDG
jgi:hypothetical protein